MTENAQKQALQDSVFNGFAAAREIALRVKAKRPFRTNEGDCRMLAVAVQALEQNLRLLFIMNASDEAWAERLQSLDEEGS